MSPEIITSIARKAYTDGFLGRAGHGQPWVDLDDAQKAATVEVVEDVLNALGKVLPEPDNHHNAAACPYCTPGADQHILELREDGWALQHPYACRPHLLDCQVNESIGAVAEQLARDYEPGLYRASLVEDGLVRLEEVSAP